MCITGLSGSLPRDRGAILLLCGFSTWQQQAEDTAETPGTSAGCSGGASRDPCRHTADAGELTLPAYTVAPLSLKKIIRQPPGCPAVINSKEQV